MRNLGLLPYPPPPPRPPGTAAPGTQLGTSTGIEGWGRAMLGGTTQPEGDTPWVGSEGLSPSPKGHQPEGVTPWQCSPGQRGLRDSLLPPSTRGAPGTPSTHPDCARRGNAEQRNCRSRAKTLRRLCRRLRRLLPGSSGSALLLAGGFSLCPGTHSDSCSKPTPPRAPREPGPPRLVPVARLGTATTPSGWGQWGQKAATEVPSGKGLRPLSVSMASLLRPGQLPPALTPTPPTPRRLQLILNSE